MSYKDLTDKHATTHNGGFDPFALEVIFKEFLNQRLFCNIKKSFDR